jgi:hypothetical protein
MSTLRKLIFPTDLSAKIVKPDTLLLQNVSTDVCVHAGRCVCVHVFVFLGPKKANFCGATINFIIFCLLET